ncbi:protein FRG1-like [Sycon ciliatum]|uniref:protein FRG1-like n=1 Tax=Sycon ciliatum TaxID=27933 RepID=UPI0031F6BCAA
MAEYVAKPGKLWLKGEKKPKKKKSHKRKHESDDEAAAADNAIEGEVLHETWRRVRDLVDVKGPVCLVSRTGAYIAAQDDGCFVEGVPGESEKRPPNEAEEYLGYTVGDEKVALKSGYGKYMCTSSSGDVVGRSDAIGTREMWDPIFQDGLIAFEGSNRRFMTVEESGKLMSTAEKVSDDAKFTLRTSKSKFKKAKTEVEKEYGKKLSNLEMEYVNRYQSFQDHHVIVTQKSRDELRGAREKGKLHESLLDRRAKMKSDRYCK